RQLNGIALVQQLGSLVQPGDRTAVSSSLHSAAEVTAALRRFRWDRLDPLTSAPDDEEAQRILSRIRVGLAEDEIVTRAAGVLTAAEDAVFEWLATRRQTPVAPS